LNRLLARSLVFFTSAAVLVIEILAARLLAPYLGVSLEVFTGIIGVILAGISLGAWIGGRSADRVDPKSLLGPLLMAGGVTALASPLIIDAIGPTLSTDAVNIVFAAAAGFFAPAAILSAVSPVVVKIQLNSLERTGSVVGTYSAIGTAGAILGTFATGFVLIASFPTRPIVMALGMALTVAGVLMTASRGRWALLALAGAGLLSLGLLVWAGPCEHETTYHCAVVEKDSDRPTGRVLILDRVRNSYVDLADPTYLEFRYVELIADVIENEAPPGPLDVVSIGGGGFTVPGYIEQTRPGSKNIVLEIDSKLVEIGREELGLDDEVVVVVDDARTSLGNVGDGSADVVVGDAYSGASVPWHLTTLEFNRQIDRVLALDGLYVMNVIDYEALEFVRAEAATLLEVFAEVALFAPPHYLAGEAGGNFILVASQDPIEVDGIENRIRDRGGSESGITGERLRRFIDDAMVLTDDFAPVDQILGRPGL
jgi:spermidine synthase/stage V sporulation protein SpoVS